MNIQNYFTKIYQLNSWQSNESKSGPGSERNNNTICNLINIVLNLINMNLVDNTTLTLVDCPCGDFNWIDLLFSSILKNTKIKTIKYYAYDIVPDLLEKFNSITKIDNVEYNFNVLDITTQIPIKSDLIICKELFIHLSFNDIKKTINNFINSESTYFVSNDFENIENIDINEYKNNCLGECRPVCLTLPPFNLCNYIIDYQDYKGYNLKNINLL
jgi:hypothetical protein